MLKKKEWFPQFNTNTYFIIENFLISVREYTMIEWLVS